MKWQPLGARVLVRRDKPVEKTPGGVIIPEGVEPDEQIYGIVVASGRPCFNQQGLEVKSMLSVGDRVLLAAWSGTVIKVEGEELRLIYEDAIIAVERAEPVEKKARVS
jgi:chaperonin GroES